MDYHPRCDCHECTQARYRLSFQGQIDQAMTPRRNPDSLEQPSPLHFVPNVTTGGTANC
jgi:hypothetical protein